MTEIQSLVNPFVVQLKKVSQMTEIRYLVTVEIVKFDALTATSNSTFQKERISTFNTSPTISSFSDVT